MKNSHHKKIFNEGLFELTVKTIRAAWIFLATVYVLNLSKQGVKSLPSWFALMQGCLVDWLLPD